MELDQLWKVADRARNSTKLSQEDSVFVRRELPKLLHDFPHLKLPKRITHPAGFAVTGASIGTFVRCASLIAARRVLGTRYNGSDFYESIEKDLALRIMRSHFHPGRRLWSLRRNELANAPDHIGLSCQEYAETA